MIKVTVENVPDFTIISRGHEGLEVISQRTGTHYSLLEGKEMNPHAKTSATSDIIFIMKLEPYIDEDTGEEDGYVYADGNCFVDYLFGASLLEEQNEDVIQYICELIYKYENK